MSNDAQLYEYSLDPQRHEIRTITLKAGNYHDKLSCTLKVVSLDDGPCYEALSYVWGPSDCPETVSVNDITITVTRYLEIALRHLRKTTTDRILWIDAVCINQKDVSERNSQVTFMGDIYRSADQVLVRLGEADKESDLAFNLMPKVDINFIKSKEASDVWSFFYNATRRPYMSRVWIIQEFVLAKKDPVVLCGYKHALWSTFMSAYKTLALDFFTQIDQIKEEAAGKPPTVLAKLRYDLLDELRTTVNQDGGADLRQLFIMSRSSQSSEPRDRIYGLLQMLEDEDRKFFKIDYNKPIAMIYAEAMALIFKQGDGPFFLAGLWCPSKANPAIPDLPSWVPDFSRQTAELASPVPLSTSFWPASPRSVSGAGAGADNGKVMEDFKTLQVEVLPVDVVEHVLYFDNTLQNCLQQLDEVERLAMNAKSRMISDGMLRPFIERFRSSQPLWRTLVSDKAIRSGYDAAPDSYEAMYSQIRRLESGTTLQHSSTMSEYYLALETHLPGRTFFTTQCGFVGIGMPTVQNGDEVTIWFGATVPFVTRLSTQDPTKYSLIGAAYVAGIMEGEMVDELYCEDLLDSKRLLVV
jgi:hypothetical protein